MPIWEWMAAGTIILSWAVFLYLLSRRHRNFASLIVGALHMLFAATLSFAPFRSWFAPGYLGLSLGFLRFEGRGATFPCAVMLAWALAAAWIAVAKGSGKWMILVLAGDTLWALNFGGSMLLGQGAEKSKVQLGETATFVGASALLILLSFYVLPFVLSAFWPHGIFGFLRVSHGSAPNSRHLRRVQLVPAPSLPGSSAASALG